MADGIRRQEKRHLAANWTSNNPTLLSAEWGYETDTGKYKIGDGTTAWNDLGYAGGGGSSGTGIISNPGSGEYRITGLRLSATGEIVVTYSDTPEP